MKRLIKKLSNKVNASHSISSRDEALLYINGEILVGYNHPALLREYLANEQNKLNEIIDKYIEYNYFDQEKADELREKAKNGGIDWAILEPFCEYDRPNTNLEQLTNEKLAFAHIVYDEVNNDTDEEYSVAIYLETNSLVNVTKEEVINDLKNEYPDAHIFDDDSYDGKGTAEKYEKIADLRCNKSKFKKLNYHDYGLRDYAIMIIDNKVYTGDMHCEIYKDYNDENENSVTDVEKVAFGHVDVNNKAIFIELNNL